MNILERLGKSGIVPVVVIDEVKDAVPTAKAMIKGGINVMEITLRTEAGLESITKVAKECPEMTVGAGTVLTVEMTKKSVAAGAKFIVSPGLDVKQVKWCTDNGVAITPGCVTPTEIMTAMELGIKVMKFFPANIYGGLSAMKSLAGPFGNIKFIPTGGINEQNLAEYIAAPFIHAVGGSWLCAKEDIAANNFNKITGLCAGAMQKVMGFEIAHVGINTADEADSMEVCREFASAFGFEIKEGNTSNFSSGMIEVMKSVYLGKNGHLAVRTNNIERAIAFIGQKGYTVDMGTAKYKKDKLIAVYMEKQIGGFAIHLLQK